MVEKVKNPAPGNLKPLSYYEQKNKTSMWPKSYKVNFSNNCEQVFDDFFKLNGSNFHKI